MTNTRTLRRNTPPRRQSHLAVIELPDEISAFQAYRLLQYHGISPENLAIVGDGYSSPERIGLLRPMQIAQRKSFALSIMAGSLGALSGTFLVLASNSQEFAIPPLLSLQNYAPHAWLIIPGLSLVSGFLGAVIGGLIGFFGEGTAAGIYRHRLRQGQYLLMIEGSEKLVRWGQEVLSQYSTSRLY
ncbi:hypothetical protein IQ266_23480 [filamentous cyanobacterium LEGE 11480]|uniref:Uncharacterized protein n=1 Tax=Romeriopsis navalis LEGE 11480 TaxID=2777977 RepID=A0A928Z6J5_9CYAN|nr:hypothetical protein [Romeriopsis navalis]MBE9032703.1 hypothetical protein [Romeriopsis navalis LEGE 11480]